MTDTLMPKLASVFAEGYGVARLRADAEIRKGRTRGKARPFLLAGDVGGMSHPAYCASRAPEEHERRDLVSGVAA